ncbi:MAG: glycosyltransferase family 4 protein [Deltaproteobacteria bacterium]|nr:glycosyltransferase family 4 protein [Deltaproteobacteria bacterium]
MSLPRVLIVAEHASAAFGGEAVLPLHYFRWLRQRGADVHLVVHARTQQELTQLLGGDIERVHFIADEPLHIAMHKAGQALPARLAYFSTGLVSRVSTQWAARTLALDLIKRHKLEVVHQPIPVSPKEPSLLANMGVPVVIGPLNGGMTYPPAFAKVQSGAARALVNVARPASHVVHRALRGKLTATTILVANERTRAALPHGMKGHVATLVENGVDLDLFAVPEPRQRKAGELKALFVGRLVDWKALDIVLDALAQTSHDITLDVLGDGPMRAAWESHARALGARVRFLGFVPQPQVAQHLANADALVLPSLYECGGAVVLEAMAVARPVIATAWGGPADYLTSDTGILVPPHSRPALVAGFAAGLQRLANDAALAQTMGTKARERVAAHFGWPQKIDQILDVYREAIARHTSATR